MGLSYVRIFMILIPRKNKITQNFFQNEKKKIEGEKLNKKFLQFLEKTWIFILICHPWK